jgi:PAS domain S-box-containing protein
LHLSRKFPGCLLIYNHGMFSENYFVKFLRRLVEQDTGIHDKGSKRMIIAVLTAALLTDSLFVVFRINPEVMLAYGVLLLGVYILAIYGFLTPARLVIPLGGLMMFGYLMLINKGIRDIALLGLPIIIIGSGLLYGKPGTLIYGILSFLTLVLIDIAEANGLMPRPVFVTNTQIDYLAAEVGIILVAILQWLVIDRLNENIKKAQRNEEDQRLANEALSLSESRYRSLVEESPEGILITDGDGKIVLANPFACNMLGFEEAELVGRFAPDLIDPEDLAQRPVPVENLLAGEIIQRERLLVRKDGVRIPVMGSNRHMPDGRFQYIFQDISKQKQAEAEREALIHELENKNAELERFTYTVSHDLKSPLVTIRGFLGYLEQDVRKGNADRMQDDLRRIENATDRMNRLLTDLLELSRIGRLMNPPQDVSFEKIVQEAVELVEGRIKERNVKVQVQTHLPVVFGDHARFVEVVQNLIDNAVKFMGPQVEPLIEIGTHNDQQPTVFFVRDNGIGIAPEFHERVFGLFNRLDQNIEGTGIGLALVKRIIEVHGGRIWIESTGNGEGSTFCFTLAEK